MAGRKPSQTEIAPNLSHALRSSFEIGPDGFSNQVQVFLNGVDTVEPIFFGILPDEITPLLTPGMSASFSTFVDYGQGQVNRTADYPVFETFGDFISQVYVTLDAEAGEVNFFLKRTPVSPLNVVLVDLTGAPQIGLGGGVALVSLANN